MVVSIRARCASSAVPGLGVDNAANMHMRANLPWGDLHVYGHYAEDMEDSIGKGQKPPATSQPAKPPVVSSGFENLRVWP